MVGWLRLAIMLSVAVLVPDQEYRLASPIQNADDIAGPWETATPSGVEGIHILISTAPASAPDSKEVRWQTFNVNVYKRHGHDTENGWFAAKYEPSSTKSESSPDTSELTFSGDHLQIADVQGSSLAPFKIDLVYKPAEHVWTGSWSQAGDSTEVTLTRPETPHGGEPDVIIGDWKGEPSAPGQMPHADAIICIRQSSDTVFTAWMNRDLSNKAMLPTGEIARVGDIRSGEVLQFVSFERGELRLETANSAGANYDYVGTLSADGNRLIGFWQSVGPGGELNAPQNFHRVTQ
jgi:hypothetical protein